MDIPKPTIVLVPGAFFTPEHFKPLALNLTQHGYKCVSIALPSNQSTDLPPATLSDDASAIRQSVESELDMGNDVVIVAHSYGAVPTNNALQGFDKHSRGGQTAVLALVFMAAAFVTIGNTFVGEFGGKPTALCSVHYPFVDVNEPGAAHWFFQDLPFDEAKKWSSEIVTVSWKAYEEPVQYAAMDFIPSWYLCTTNDAALPLEIQRFFVQRARDSGARFTDKTIQEVASAHAPFLARVEETSAFVREAAREVSVGVEQDEKNAIRIASQEMRVNELNHL